MRCKKCNVEIPKDNMSCPNCGKSVMELKSLGMLEKELEEEVFAELKRKTTTGEENDVEVFNEEVNENDDNETFVLDENNISQNEALELFEADDDLMVKKTKKGKKSVITCIGVIAAIVLILGLGFLLYLKYQPKLVFMSAIKNTIKTFESGLNNEVQYDSILTDYDIKLKFESKNSEYGELFDVINKFSVEGKMQVDYKNNKFYMSMDSYYDNSDLLKIGMILKEKQTLVKLENLYDKYIETDLDESINFKQDIEKDYKIVINKFLNTVIKSLRLEYFSKEKQGDMTKNTLKLSQKQCISILKGVLTKLKNDDEFITSLVNIIEKDKSEVIKELEENIKELEKNNDNYSENKYIEIAIFTSGIFNKVKEAEISYENDRIFIRVENENSFKISYRNGENVFDVNVLNRNDDNINRLIIEITSNEDKIILEINYSVKYNEKVEISENVESVRYEDLSDEVMGGIAEKFLNQKGLQKLLDDTGLGELFFGSGVDDVILPENFTA